MNISLLIYEFLTAKGNVSILGFGKFSMENAPAEIMGGRITPPAKKISFQKNTAEIGKEFTRFYSQKKQLSYDEAEKEIQIESNIWNMKIEEGDSFEIDNIGNFYINEGVAYFVGHRIETDNPDFYGLENIIISNISSRETPPNSKGYRFNQSVLWLFLLIIPISGIVYLAVDNREMLFGKESFLDNSYKNSTHRIQNPTPKKSNDLLNDSIKVDTAVTH